MTDSAHLTAADAMLLEALAARGWQVSPRQLKRWRAEGLLAPPIQRSAGRGLGRPSLTYPAEAVEQADCIAVLLSQGVPLHYAAVGMMLRKVPVNLSALRTSLKALLRVDRPVEWMTQDEAADYADAVAQRAVVTTDRTGSRRLRQQIRRHPLTRYWSQQVSRLQGARYELLLDIMVGLLTSFFAHVAPSEVTKKLITRILQLTDEQMDAFFSTIRILTRENLLDFIDVVTVEQLYAARELLLDHLPDPTSSSPVKPNVEAAGLIVLGLTLTEDVQSRASP